MNALMLPALALAPALLLVVPVRGQADGNPHHWDRRRRCDQTDYAPPCGVCEGVGGIPYGDANDQIHLASCVPVAAAAASATLDPAPVHPKWGPAFTAEHYNEVLIGPKTDPFCFNSFPSNSSAGKLCYRPDSGRQVYDAVHAHALRYDLNVKTAVGNVSTTIVHQNRNMWIINHLPWYAAGVHQCICTTVHAGGAEDDGRFLYPVVYNWTDQMLFVGRERVGIEYTGIENYSEVVDHWAFGPHHVWSTPGTGEVRRMWQPFNGLEVFSGPFNRSAVDESLFDHIPPELCKKKGGAAIRIKCDDNGMPVVPNATADDPSRGAPSSTKPSKDVQRALKPKPGKAYRGATFSDMSSTLNRWLVANKRVDSSACSTWTARELQQLQGMLYLLRNEDLDKIYQHAQDNRRMRAAAADMAEDWAALNRLVEHHPGPEAERSQLATIQRDGHCHEAVMWFVHHLTEDVKAVLSQDTKVRLPLLSDTLHSSSGEACGMGAGPSSSALAQVCGKYREQVTCASCHSDVHPPGHRFLSAAEW